MYKFFRDDLDALDAKLDELKTLIKETNLQIGAACEDGEREHDNPEFDDANRRFEMWSRHLGELTLIRSKADIVEAKDIRIDKVSLGCKVTFVDQNDSKRTISIGSYIPSENSGEISYNAPVAKMLIGLKVGESREGEIANLEVEFEVLKIERAREIAT